MLVRGLSVAIGDRGRSRAASWQVSALKMARFAVFQLLRLRTGHPRATKRDAMATDTTSNSPDAGINQPTGPSYGSQRRLRDRLFAIGWAASAVGATVGWLLFLQRMISYSMSWLYQPEPQFSGPPVLGRACVSTTTAGRRISYSLAAPTIGSRRLARDRVNL
jgi:hypothetical protein